MAQLFQWGSTVKVTLHPDNTLIYSKIPKYSDTRNIAVIILKFEQGDSTKE